MRRQLPAPRWNRVTPRCLVRIDPEIWTEPDWADCHRNSQYAFMDSLFYLAKIGEPQGFYPHARLVEELTSSEAELAVRELTALGAWTFVGLGYRVHPYCGWAVVPERRSAIPAAVRRRVLDRDNRQCQRCGATSDLALDHIYPWSKGGPDTEGNLRVLCRSCNSSKGARI